MKMLEVSSSKARIIFSVQGADLDELRKIAYEEEKIKELTINMSENIGKLLK